MKKYIITRVREDWDEYSELQTKEFTDREMAWALYKRLRHELVSGIRKEAQENYKCDDGVVTAIRPIPGHYEGIYFQEQEVEVKDEMGPQ